ncbi:MAG TPA: hypothetical protein VD963_07515 [Phycisphaerales bacterium]|nr:hypothetical protein [Phycisphaerales bacterium]
MNPWLSELVAHVAAPPGALWIAWRQRFLRRRGTVLTPAECRRLGGFFAPALLSRVRVVRVAHMPGPPGARALVRLGVSGVLDPARIAGMALGDVVVICEPAAQGRGLDPMGLLFHELVHVAQYRALGRRGFVAHYVRGWLRAGRSYAGIPLETQAHDLQARFLRAPDAPFSVEHEVVHALASQVPGV